MEQQVLVATGCAGDWTLLKLWDWLFLGPLGGSSGPLTSAVSSRAYTGALSQ